MRLTHVGTATLLLEVGKARILTDPALDPGGKRYRFRLGFSSTKLEDPRVPAGGLEPIDLVLLSHDHHADNLDAAGRELLPRAGRVLTTPKGARRLGGNAFGLAPWESIVLGDLKVTAVPARHGPPLIEVMDGETTGFVVEHPAQTAGALYISGDTVYFGGIPMIGQRFKIATAILHLGGVRFGITGPLRYTFTAKGAVEAVRALGRPRVVPVHYEGWAHFHEPRSEFEKAFSAEGFSVHWLPRGDAVELPD
jgi:L-ascorbate metabolism protein UlaG (beta-lactamase superfamily)